MHYNFSDDIIQDVWNFTMFVYPEAAVDSRHGFLELTGANVCTAGMRMVTSATNWVWFCGTAWVDSGVPVVFDEWQKIDWHVYENNDTFVLYVNDVLIGSEQAPDSETLGKVFFIQSSGTANEWYYDDLHVWNETVTPPTPPAPVVDEVQEASDRAVSIIGGTGIIILLLASLVFALNKNRFSEETFKSVMALLLVVIAVAVLIAVL